MTGSMRGLLIVEVIVGLAMPVAMLVAGAVALPVVLPMLVTALPTDLETSTSPARTIALPLLMLYGVVAGSIGLYAVIAMLRAVLGGARPRISRSTLWMLLALGVSALAVPFLLLGTGRPVAWLLGLVLPVAVVAHLAYLYRTRAA